MPEYKLFICDGCENGCTLLSKLKNNQKPTCTQSKWRNPEKTYCRFYDKCQLVKEEEHCESSHYVASCVMYQEFKGN